MSQALGLGAAVCAGVAVWLAHRPQAATARQVEAVSAPQRRRGHWAPIAAAFGTWAFMGGWRGLAVATVVGIVVAVVLARAEAPDARRRRLSLERELPQVVLILAAALQAGAPVQRALGVTVEALPGPAADELAAVVARLHVGVSVEDAWAPLRSTTLAPLARAMTSSARSGSPVAESVSRLAADLAAQRRAAEEMRARTVGVRAAVPLGLCLLPAFVVLGIVPVVAGLLATLVG